MADIFYEQATYYKLEQSMTFPNGNALSKIYELPSDLYGVAAEEPVYITGARLSHNGEYAARPQNAEGLWFLLLDVGGALVSHGYPATQPPVGDPAWDRLTILAQLDVSYGKPFLGTPERFAVPHCYRRDRGDRILLDLVGCGSTWTIQPWWTIDYVRTQ